MTKRNACVSVLALGAAMMATMVMGCVGQGGDGENTGEAQVTISQVPIDGSVGCIEVTATGSITKTKSVDVAPGQSTVLALDGLPVGTVSFVGNAYQGPCAGVTSLSAPTWISEAVLASVSNVPPPVMVHLAMYRSGQAGVDVGFEDGTCREIGAPCFTGAECCSQSCVANTCQSASQCPPGLTGCNGACVDLMSDFANCGACGAFCPGGVCAGGACGFGPPSCVDGIKNGAETDVDCGGPSCAPCTNGKACVVASDCVSASCANNVCAQSSQQCLTPLDCPGADTECQSRTCIGGVCGVSYPPFGTPVSGGSSGDCLSLVCAGNGGVAILVDDTDVPNSGNPCVIGACSGGISSYVMAPFGTPCNQNGTACDGNGNCI